VTPANPWWRGNIDKAYFVKSNIKALLRHCRGAPYEPIAQATLSLTALTTQRTKADYNENSCAVYRYFYLNSGISIRLLESPCLLGGGFPHVTTLSATTVIANRLTIRFIAMPPLLNDIFILKHTPNMRCAYQIIKTNYRIARLRMSCSNSKFEFYPVSAGSISSCSAIKAIKWDPF
jgi:hypothetical protein